MSKDDSHDRCGSIAVRGIDHIAFTVPDLDRACAFFVRILGARELYRRSYAGDGSDMMAERFNAHPLARATIAKLDLAGTDIELFEYGAPDLRREMPRNCDAGGSHFGIRVDDMEAAVARLRSEPGVRILGAPSALPADHPLAGRTWVYFITPWGLQLELVCDG